MGDTSGGAAATAIVVAENRSEDVSAMNVVVDGGSRTNINVLEDGIGGGNRWPRQETLALLKIRSEMDATFRDSTLKAPLWEQISRKLGELGYKRSAKKCKEKFENVYKYHKRTKDGRRPAPGKPDKTYRFFDELEAFDQSTHQATQSPHPNISSWPTVTSISTINQTSNPSPNPTTITTPPTVPMRNNHPISSSSSSTASDEEFQAPPPRPQKRKRKWKDIFRRLTRQVVRRQEEMQNKFLETIARCETERASREDAWRALHISTVSRDHDERSVAATNDAALIDLLRKLSAPTAAAAATNAIPISFLPPSSRFDRRPSSAVVAMSSISPCTSPCSSRWPKTEVEALINMRTTLEAKYHESESGPKGPLWEEISAGMRRLGYERSAKRCKEKWENINKYFKKVRETDKKRSEDSKTCPYFHKLDALYREKITNGNGNAMMVQPERQWPIHALQQNNSHDLEDNEQEDDGLLDRDSSSTEVEDLNQQTYGIMADTNKPSSSIDVAE